MFNWILPLFSATEKTIRDAAARAIRASLPDPKPAFRKVALDRKDETTAHLLALAADANGSLHKSMISNVKEGQPTPSKDEDDLTSSIFTAFHRDLEIHPFPKEHLTMLNEILGHINDTNVNIEEPLSLNDFKENVIESINTYFTHAVTWFQNQKFTSLADYQSRNTKREIWYSNNYPTAPYRDEHNRDLDVASEHQDMITSIANAMTHNQVPDNVVLLLLIQPVSAAGYLYFMDADYPTYLNFMPPNWVLKNRDELWSLRMQNKFDDEDQHYDPNETDDAPLSNFEHEEFISLNVFDFEGQTTNEPDQKPPGRPPMDEDSKHSNRRKAERERKKNANNDGNQDDSNNGSSSSGQQGQQPPPVPPPNPQVPDDANYSPDPNWARREKGIISYIQSLPTMDMRRDHMTRFQVTNEQPTSIPKSQVDPRANGDIDVFFGKTKFSQHYLITFTRKSRKPIFNPIN